MARWSLAAILAELEGALAWLRKSAGYLVHPVRPAAEPPIPGVTQFGEYERIEETKYFPPAVPPREPAETGPPELYGKTRLALLVVDPYLVHAYWEVVPEEAEEAARRAWPCTAVLRFFEAPGGDSSPDYFDVDVALEPGNWNVRLWSADKSYFAELGWRGSDGTFVPLARSNTVRTPRAWPVAPVEERYAVVEDAGPEHRLVAMPAAAPAHEAPKTVPTVDAEPDAADTPASSVIPAATPSRPPAPPSASAELLHRKLAELYAFRNLEQEQPYAPGDPGLAVPGLGVPGPVLGHPTVPGAAVPGPAIPPVRPPEPRSDLTAAAEKQFAPGVSSALLPERRPET